MSAYRSTISDGCVGCARNILRHGSGKPGWYVMWTTVRNVLTCCLLAAVTALVVQTILFVHVATQAVAVVPVIANQTRADALKIVGDTRQDLLVELKSLQWEATRIGDGTLSRLDDLLGSSNERLKQAVDVADKRLGETIEIFSATLKPIPGLFAGIDDTNRTLRETVASIRPTIDHVNEATAILFRRDALPAQILGLVAASKVTMGETAQTMRAIERATPGILSTFGTLEKSAAATAENLNRLTKPRWYDRALGYGSTAVTTYRALHPATDLRIQGTQYLATRP